MNPPDTPSFSTIKQARGMFWRCDLPATTFHDLSFLEGVFKEAIMVSNATIVKLDHHRYEPQGITLVAILEDSHAVLHTWPERSFIMVEIFTCGDRATPAAGITYLASQFKPRHHETTENLVHI